MKSTWVRHYTEGSGRKYFEQFFGLWNRRWPSHGSFVFIRTHQQRYRLIFSSDPEAETLCQLLAELDRKMLSPENIIKHQERLSFVKRAWPTWCETEEWRRQRPATEQGPRQTQNRGRREPREGAVLSGASPLFSEVFHFGLWLSARRQALGLSQEDLQRKIGLHAQNISAIEKGRRRPGRRTRLRLIEFFNSYRAPPRSSNTRPIK